MPTPPPSDPWVRSVIASGWLMVALIVVPILERLSRVIETLSRVAREWVDWWQTRYQRWGKTAKPPRVVPVSLDTGTVSLAGHLEARHFRSDVMERLRSGDYPAARRIA